MVTLAKPALDVGLYTNSRDSMLTFWQQDAQVEYDELLPVGRGVHQLRHKIGHSILKVNHTRAALDSTPKAGYHELRIARQGIDSPRSLTDPDGNRVTLVPHGHDGITQIELVLNVRDVAAHEDFYGRVLGLPRVAPQRFACGESLLSIRADASVAVDPPMQALGYRYITLQVYDVVGEHAVALERGGREGSAPVRLGEVAYISFIRDPDGNWIELSQRKSITGSLDSPSAARYT